MQEIRDPDDEILERRPWTQTYKLQRAFIGFINALFNYIVELIEKNEERKKRLNA